jgi:hypothetical protein
MAAKQIDGKRRLRGQGHRQWLGNALCAGLVLTAVIGCGTGSYNALVSQRLEQLNREAPYVALNSPTPIAGTSVSLAIPKVLTSPINLDTADESGLNGKISAERVQFARVPLPGTFLAYEVNVPIGEGMKAPMALQIAIFPKSDPRAAEVPQAIDAAVKKLFDKDIVWEDVEASSLGGAKVPWKVVRYEGELLFDQIPDDPNAPIMFRKAPAKAELWWHESDAYHTYLMWRVPAAAEGEANFLSLAPLTAGLISVGAPPAAPGEGDAAPADGAPAAADAAPAEG